MARKTLVLGNELISSDDSSEKENEVVEVSRKLSTRSSTISKRSAKISVTQKKPAAPVKAAKVKQAEEKPSTTDSTSLSYDQLIDKASTDHKGQKTLLKRLYTEREQLLATATASRLRRILYEHAILLVPDGIKLAAAVVHKLGAEESIKVIRRALNRKIDGAPWGEMLYVAWKTGKTEEDKDQIEEMVTQLIECAVMLEPPHCTAYSEAVLEVSKDRNNGIHLAKSFCPIIWRALKSTNAKVRFNASGLYLRVFPLVDRDVEDNDQAVTFETQCDYMLSLLQDECCAIREDAANRALKNIANYYPLFKSYKLKELLSFIFDELSQDTIPAIRVAVLEGTKSLIPISVALNAVDVGLRTIIPRMMNDRNEKVRQKAFEVLCCLKGHRFIKYFKVVEVEDVLSRLEVETSEVVIQEIVKLLFPSFMPMKSGHDERVMRVALLAKHGRQCALHFHRHLFKDGYLTVEQAAEHVRILTLAIYLNWRRGAPSADIPSMDTTSTSLDETVQTLNSSQATLDAFPVPDEACEVWKRDKHMLECAVVLYFTFAKELEKPEHMKDRVKTEAIFGKVFRKLYKYYRKTSLLGTMMVLGSMIPPSSLSEYTSDVLDQLKKAKAEEECFMPYMEAAAKWDIEGIHQIIQNGLDCLSMCSPGLVSPAPKKPKKNQRTTRRTSTLGVESKIQQALRYLQYIFHSAMISNKLTPEYLVKIEHFYKSMSPISSYIVKHMADPSSEVDRESAEEEDKETEPMPFELSQDDVVQAYQTRNGLAVMLLRTASESDSRNDTMKEELTRDMHENIYFFFNEVAAKLQTVKRGDRRFTFIMKLAQAMLRNIGNVMHFCDLDRVVLSKEADSARRSSLSAGVASEPESVSFSDTALYALGNLVHPSNPYELLLPAFEALSSFFNADDIQDVIDHLITIMIKIPKWINKQIESVKEEDEKAIGDGFLSLLRTLYDCPETREEHLDEVMKTICSLVVRQLLLQIEDKHEIEDPRDPTFEVPLLVQVLLLRAICRQPQFMKIFTHQLEQLCTPEVVSSSLDANLCVMRLAAFAQLSIIADPEIAVPLLIRTISSQKPSQKNRTILRQQTEKTLDVVRDLLNLVLAPERTRPDEDLLTQFNELMKK